MRKEMLFSVPSVSGGWLEVALQASEKKIPHRHTPMRKDTEISSHPLPPSEEQETEDVPTLQTHQTPSLSSHTAILSDDLKAACRLQLINPSKFPHGISSLQERGSKFNWLAWSIWQDRNVSLGLTQDSIWVTSDLPAHYNRSCGEFKCSPKTSRWIFSILCLSFLHRGHSFINMKHVTSVARTSFSLYICIMYIKKENITWKITSLCNSCIFRTVEASGALVLSSSHCSWKSRRQKYTGGITPHRLLVFQSTDVSLLAYMLQQQSYSITCQHTWFSASTYYKTAALST